MSINDTDFTFYQNFLYEKSGLAIRKEKIYLLESRLTPLAKKEGFETLEKLTEKLKLGTDKNLENLVIDAMTTNETLFFRDDRPFRYFKTHLVPKMEEIRDTTKSMRIWSAACSTGQEPYSIIMSLLENLKAPDLWRIHMLGTDISDSALTQAKEGIFNQFEIQRGMPIQLLMKYFTQEDTKWRIQDKIRKMVKYENFNLLEPMEKYGTFDMIFCRNVLIYFDAETKAKILKAMIKRLAPDGYLFLGGSETAIGICPELEISTECPGLYTLKNTSSSSTISAPINNTQNQTLDYAAK